MVNIFFPKEATVKIDAAGTSSISASTVLDTAFSAATSITGQFKNIQITSSLGDVEQVDLFGTTSGFQNAEMEEKPAGPWQITATLVLPGDEMAESELFGTGTAAGGTHTTYQTGLATRTKVEVLLNVDDGTDEVNWAVDNAYLTQYDASANADGHFEIPVTLKGLPKDFYGPQFKD